MYNMFFLFKYTMFLKYNTYVTRYCFINMLNVVIFFMLLYLFLKQHLTSELSLHEIYAHGVRSWGVGRQVWGVGRRVSGSGVPECQLVVSRESVARV
jgi:hypothetical protein